ncbi:MAG: YceI family protein [Sulfurimonadaceae bacterium]
MKMIALIVMMAVMAFSGELKVDEKASSINFEATKMFFVGVDGNFSDFSGTISVEGDAITAVNGVITVLSIDTDNKKRDDHLLSSDFFHEVAFKSIVFKSTEVTDDTVVADITIKDITKTVTFAMEKIDVSEKGVKVKLAAVVDRTEFDIDNNFMSMIIFNNIDITSTLIAK